MRQLSAPPNVTPEMLAQAELNMWVTELRNPRANWKTRHVAGQRICEILGIAEAVRAQSTNGMLRLPPAWPEIDCVPVGGGVGFITTAVRSMIEGQRREVEVRIPRADGVDMKPAIEEALLRGRFALRKKWCAA